MLKYNSKILFTFVFLLIVLPQSLFASEIDSLKLLLTETHDAVKKIEIYTLLSKKYKYVDNGEASRLAKEAMNLSEQTGNEEFLRDIYGLLGDLAVINDSLELARDYYLTTVKILENQNDINGLVKFTLVLGNIAYVRDNLVEALRNYHLAVEYVKESGNEEHLDNLYMNIGSINFRMQNNQVAQEYFTKALEGFLRSDDSLNIAGTYSNMGLIYSELKNYRAAEDYFARSLEIYMALKMNTRISETYLDMATDESSKENFEQAIDFLLLALEYSQKKDPLYKGPRQILLAVIYERLGSNYLSINNINEANSFLLEGYRLGLSNGQIETVSRTAKGLSEIWKEKEQFDSSYHYLEIHKTYSDSLSNTEIVKQLAYQNARFEFEQQRITDWQEREKELEEQKRRKLLFIFIIVILVLLLIVLVLFLKLGRNKVKRVELEHESLRKEFELSKKELELRNKELTTHVLYQVKNNEFILNLSKKLKIALSTILPANRAKINEVIRDIEQDSSHETWKEFELRFQNVYTNFYKKLSKDYPDLTSNELRICAFLKLNMSTKDIAAITYQTTSSITVARWRLRKKFGLDKDANLVSFLAKF